MSTFKRVKDKATGIEYSTRRPIHRKVEVLNKPATNDQGKPLPPEHKKPHPGSTGGSNESGGGAAKTAKESSK